VNAKRELKLDSPTKDAIEELKQVIRARYPEATFELGRGQDDPDSLHLLTTVDVEDSDEVMDLVIDRVIELQVEKQLPIHVIPLRPLARVLEEMDRKKGKTRRRTQLADLPSSPL